MFHRWSYMLPISPVFLTSGQDSSSWCQTPRLGYLTWGYNHFLSREDLCPVIPSSEALSRGTGPNLFLFLSNLIPYRTFLQPWFFKVFLPVSTWFLVSVAPCEEFFFFNWRILALGFPSGSAGKEHACQCRRHRDSGSLPGSGGSPVEGNGNPVQDSCLTSKTEEPGGLRAMGPREAPVTGLAAALPALHWRLALCCKQGESAAQTHASLRLRLGSHLQMCFCLRWQVNSALSYPDILISSLKLAGKNFPVWS